jgi:hypothetical protein
MSTRDDVPSDRAADADHVFDQANGVLGDDDEPVERRKGSKQPPQSFGVPPIVSL